MWYCAVGLHVGDVRAPGRPTRLKSSSSRSTSASAAMASRCSTALVEPPSAIDDRDGVLERLLGHDLAGPDAGLQQLARPPRRDA